jgi:hypothetical protein
MDRIVLRVTFFLAAVFFTLAWGSADEPPAKPPRVKPPEIILRGAGPAALGAENCLALTFEISNPNEASLPYTGYRPDSFDPALAAGQISPLCQIELKRDGKWQPQPIGYCGWGMGELELAAGASATFGLMVPADDWQAIKVAVGRFSAWSGERATTTVWSAEFSRAEIEGAQAAPAPDSGLPVGKWSVEFGNGSIEVCEIRADGTVSVTEPARSSTGKAEPQDGRLVLVFQDDRSEHWTKIGKRFVVEHSFPASRLPPVTPVLGIAERAP